MELELPQRTFTDPVSDDPGAASVVSMITLFPRLLVNAPPEVIVLRGSWTIVVCRTICATTIRFWPWMTVWARTHSLPLLFAS